MPVPSEWSKSGFDGITERFPLDVEESIPQRTDLAHEGLHVSRVLFAVHEPHPEEERICRYW